MVRAVPPLLERQPKGSALDSPPQKTCASFFLCPYKTSSAHTARLRLCCAANNPAFMFQKQWSQEKWRAMTYLIPMCLGGSMCSAPLGKGALERASPLQP